MASQHERMNAGYYSEGNMDTLPFPLVEPCYMFIKVSENKGLCKYEHPSSKGRGPLHGSPKKINTK